VIYRSQNNKVKSAKELAVKLVGDGKTPNKYFVTVGYGWYKPSNNEEMIQVKNSLDSVTMLFNTREAAEHCYNGLRIPTNIKEVTGETIGQVMIEDRLTGVIKEKFIDQLSSGKFYINSF